MFGFAHSWFPPERNCMVNFGKYFNRDEFVCSHTGEAKMNQDFLDKLNQLREYYNKPMIISSGYRDVTHPIEAVKSNGGAHTTGCAADVMVDRGDAYKVLELAFKVGMTGIGVAQKGGARFLHLDSIESSTERPRPTVWSY